MNETFQYLQLATNIIIIIMFIFITVMVFKVTALLNSVLTQVDNLKGKINDVSTSIKPVIENVNSVVTRVHSIADKVDDNFHIVESALTKVKDAVDNVVEFEQNIQRKIEPPIFETINTYSAIVKGVGAFIEKFKTFKRSRMERDVYEEPAYVKESNIELENEFQKEYEDINRELNEVRDKLGEMRK